jgi:histidine triad (HIT) family protein
MENCVFCKIVEGKIPSAKVYEDAHTIAFLDINPASKGHCLVVPKKHFQDLEHADDSTLEHLLPVAKKVAHAVAKATGCPDSNLHVSNGKNAGQVVFHVHIHVVPRCEGDGIEFTYEVLPYAEGEMQEMQENIKKHL